MTDGHTNTLKYGQIDSQSDRQTDSQADRQTDKRADRQMDRQTDELFGIGNAVKATEEKGDKLITPTGFARVC